MSLLVEADWENAQPRVAEWEKKGADFLPLAGALGSAIPKCTSMRRRASCWSVTSGSRRNIGPLSGWPRTTRSKATSSTGLRRLSASRIGRRSRVGSGQGSGPDRRLSHDEGRLGEGPAVCRGRGDHLCRVGHAVRRPMLRGIERLGTCRALGAARLRVTPIRRSRNGSTSASRPATVTSPGAGPRRPVPAVAGDLPPAIVVAEDAKEDPLDTGLSAWLKGATDVATRQLRKATESRQPPGCGICLGGSGRRPGRHEAAPSLMEDVFAKHQSKAPRMFDVLQFPRPLRPGRATDARHGTDQRYRKPRKTERSWKHLILRRFRLLRRHGKRSDAENYLTRCFETRTTYAGLKSIAQAELRRSSSEAMPANAAEPTAK